MGNRRPPLRSSGEARNHLRGRFRTADGKTLVAGSVANDVSRMEFPRGNPLRSWPDYQPIGASRFCWSSQRWRGA